MEEKYFITRLEPIYRFLFHIGALRIQITDSPRCTLVKTYLRMWHPFIIAWLICLLPIGLVMRLCTATIAFIKETIKDVTNDEPLSNFRFYKSDENA